MNCNLEKLYDFETYEDSIDCVTKNLQGNSIELKRIIIR